MQRFSFVHCVLSSFSARRCAGVIGAVFAAPFFVFVAHAERPESSWVREGENSALEYRRTSLGDRIPDFSHAGYMGGGVALPHVPAVIELAPKSGDNSSRIQAAIDEVAEREPDAEGFRGAVFLEAGEWEVHSPIRILHSGIVLRGAGQGESGTILRAVGFEESRSNVIDVGTDGQWKEVEGTRQEILGDYTPLGVRTFRVEEPGKFSPGDRVILKIQRNEQWVHDIGMDRIPPRSDGRRVGQWNPQGYRHHYDRVIESVDGDRVKLDASIGEAIHRKYGGAVLFKYEFPDRIAQVGIENFEAIAEFKGRPEDQREDHAWSLISLMAVENAWVRDITTRHFVFGALRSTPSTKYVTVQDSRCLDPVGQIRGSRRYGFYIGGQLMLVQRCYANNDRHAFAFNARVPGPNVILDCLAEGSHADAGPHHRWATAGLMDNLRVPDHSIRVQNRLNFGSGHGWAGANFVVWNSEADHFMIHNPPIAKNWAIGLVGERRDPVFADPEFYQRRIDSDYLAENGTDRPPEWGFNEIGYSGWESENQPVSPASLYLRQLEARLGPEAVENISDHPYSFDE